RRVRASRERWVAAAVSGSVTLRLRRGEDYSIVDTSGDSFSYHPDKLSMERVANAAFGPTDRIGQLTMRNLDIADSRARLEQYVAMGLLGNGESDGVSALGMATTKLVGHLEAGGAESIAGGVGPTDEEEEALDWAAMEFGTD